MNYYLNFSLISSSTKNDRCQDVTYEYFIYGLEAHTKSLGMFAQLLKLNS